MVVRKQGGARVGSKLVSWVVAALALYAGAMALNRILRAVAYIAAAALLAGFAANPQDPARVLRWLWEATREPLGQLAAVLLQLGMLLWDLVLGLLQENRTTG